MFGASAFYPVDLYWIVPGDACLTCETDTVGVGPFVWNPGGTTMTDLVVSPTVNTAYFLDVDSSLHCNEVRVTVLPYACCSIPAPTDWVRRHLLPASYNGGTYRVYDTLFVDNPVSFANTTFLMQPAAVVMVAPGAILTTTGCVFKPDCPVMWAGIRMVAASSRWNSTSDQLYSAVRGVWSSGGAAFDIRGDGFFGCWTGGLRARRLGCQLQAGAGQRIRGRRADARALCQPSLAMGGRAPGGGCSGSSWACPGRQGSKTSSSSCNTGSTAAMRRCWCKTTASWGMARGTLAATVAPMERLRPGQTARGVRSLTVGSVAGNSVTVGHATSTVPTVLANSTNVFKTNYRGTSVEGNVRGAGEGQHLLAQCARRACEQCLIERGLCGVQQAHPGLAGDLGG